MPDRHATLSPSAAHRWGECTPSAMLEATLPPIVTPYAEEGTEAHSLCEKMLRMPESYRMEGRIDEDPEMWESAVYYADIIDEELAASKAETPDARLFVERELDLSDWVPESFGTADAVIVADDKLKVFDFKYGKGVFVSAINNPQLRLYALGAYESFAGIYDFSLIQTTIVQPRVHNVSSETLTVEELLDWAENYIKPRAALAIKGEGKYVPGEHCRFCRAAGICRARVEEAFSILDKADTLPPTLSDDEIPDILPKLDGAEQWIDAIRQYARERALAGHKWPGYKLVEGRSVRKIADPIRACSILERAGYQHEDIVTEKLKTITELERLVGRKQLPDLLADCIIKPPGSPTLVPESDKRSEISVINEAFKEEIV